jgi:hypothetical protein
MRTNALAHEQSRGVRFFFMQPDRTTESFAPDRFLEEPPMNHHLFRRRKILVDPFQKRLLLVYLIHFSAVLFITLGAIFLTLMVRLERTSLSFEQEQEVARIFATLNQQLWPVFWVIFSLLVVHSLIVSHRVAGPMIKLRETLRRIGDGDFSGSLTLRRSDYLRRESDVINATLETLRKRFAEVLDEQTALEGVVREMGNAIEGGSIGEIRRMHAVLGGRVRCARKVLEDFKLSDDNAAVKPVAKPAEQGVFERIT